MNRTLRPGMRVLIQGDHPHSGKSGIYIGLDDTIFGERPRVRLDDGTETFLMNPEKHTMIVIEGNLK